MIHPHTQVEYINDEVEYGLVATQLIPAGTITWILDPLDRDFSPEQFYTLGPAFQEVLEKYTFRSNNGHLILCWDNGKYVNHSFKSNCLTTAYDFEIAIRDIHPGEQLTDDYGYLNITAPFKGIDEGTKRKYVYPDDLLKYHDTWDSKIRRVFPLIQKVDQPLLKYLDQHTWNIIQKINNKEEELQSIKLNYFNPSTNGKS
jgi:hypothetical protein